MKNTLSKQDYEYFRNKYYADRLRENINNNIDDKGKHIHWIYYSVPADIYNFIVKEFSPEIQKYNIKIERR